MSGTSAIEWTEATWNPVVGCTHVSEGCDHCYAAREASGRLRTQPAYAGLAEGGRFTGEVRLLAERLDQPLRWRRPRRVFVNSMSDLFHDGVPDEYIYDVFAVMALACQHAFQVLTKRPGRMASLLSRERFQLGIEAEQWQRGLEHHWPLPNVWLGTSVETQKWADVRIPKLLETPAAVRFLSCEPLLGPLEVARWLPGGDVLGPLSSEPGMPTTVGIDWIIVGGESGPSARPMHPDWVRGIRDQAVQARVAFFFKQWGEWAPASAAGDLVHTATTWGLLPDGRRYSHDMGGDQWAQITHVYRVGKKVAGRTLDGLGWQQYPAVTP